ncbi:MAG TPA: DUF58 domain-containing protein [Phycisphaerae bacterium]|nr:DUF58 domain-containing protein [Phycisphaerae bacterium]
MNNAANESAPHLRPEVLTRISRLELRARRIVEGFVSGMHASPFKGFSIEFADHRPYSPGDEPRHIDWRVYAKSNRFYVKEYEVETNVRTHLLLDCSGSMAYPEHPGDGAAPGDPGARLSKWDYAATLAVSLAHLLVLEQSDAAGLVLFDEQVRAQLPVSAKRASLMELAEFVTRHAPAGKTDLVVPLAELAGRIPRSGLVIIISDLLADPEALIDGLQRFEAARHDVIVLHVLDHDELEFPFTDRTLFEGMEEKGIEITTDPQSLRDSYRRAVQQFIERVRGACLDRNIDYALFSTADPLETALPAFLANRMHHVARGRIRR